VTPDACRELAAAVKQGRTLEVKWEGPDACCFLVVRYEAGHGFVGHQDEIPYDVLSPWPESAARTWSEGELIGFLAELRNGTAELTA
jgi:hypothetical protein